MHTRIHLGATLGLVGLLLGGCTHLFPSTHSAGHVVFSPGYAAPFGARPTWTPGETEVAACEKGLGKVLAQHGKDLAHFNVRMAGAERAGNRVIVGDAADIDETGAQGYLTPPGSDTIHMATFGGGAGFFRFEYDPATRKITRFDFNADL